MAIRSRVVHARQAMAGMPARMVYGNDAWASNNRGQQRTLRDLRSRRSGPVDVVTQRQADQIDTLGYVLLDTPADPSAVRAVQAGYDDVIDDPAATVDMGRRIRHVVRYVKEPLRRVPAIREMLTPGALGVLDAFYAGAWAIQHVRMWRIGHIPVEEQRYHHYGNQWHCDQHPTTTLKLFVQISDGVTPENGAFRFHDVPNTRRIMRTGFIDNSHVVGPARRLMEDPRSARYFDVPAGHVAFCNTTRCLHRAGIPPEGTTRGMVQFTFGPSATGPRAADPFANLPPDPNVAEGNFA
ncbi:phytanoyl-CoA dioxygenase family protein [Actinoplanes sichuanensis]|uniref:Phytanoyl-CoA dioxygenase n=1 Tax=Actinoplanes sichuanensis TaxID=512349 RepID=A0ABW4ATG0_9ACTN|nr:hypothetical protein [Actinoplanes sichuanensis]